MIRKSNHSFCLYCITFGQLLSSLLKGMVAALIWIPEDQGGLEGYPPTDCHHATMCSNLLPIFYRQKDLTPYFNKSLLIMSLQPSKDVKNPKGNQKPNEFTI